MDEWRRLHPLTPLLRGWRFLLVLVAAFGQQGLRGEEGIDRTYLALGVLAACVLAVLLGFVAWRKTHYRLTSTELQVESGVLQRRSRRVPLARLEAVDVGGAVFARVLGLAELRLEVVGGSSSEAPLAYLTEEDARALRARLLAAAAGRVDVPAEPTHDAVLVAVPTGTLVASTVLGSPVLFTTALVLLLAGTAAIQADATAGVLLAVLPVYAGVITVAGRRVLNEYGFTVSESPDGLRLRHGLLDTRRQTIPAGRGQTVRVLESLLWRSFGWVRVEVDVAGYSAGRGQEQASTKALLPVAPRELAGALVRRVLGAGLPMARAPAAARPAAPPCRWPAHRCRPGCGGARRCRAAGCARASTTSTS